jgi:hypothetical protein
VPSSIALQSADGILGSCTAQQQMVLPFGEQLLLACAVGGSMFGLLVGRFLLGRVFGGVGGAVLGVWLYNKVGSQPAPR